MDGEQYRKLLSQVALWSESGNTFMGHGRYRGPDNWAAGPVITQWLPQAHQCGNCQQVMDHTPMRSYAMDKTGSWRCYCHGCRRYRNPVTGVFDLFRTTKVKTLAAKAPQLGPLPMKDPKDQSSNS